MAWGTIKITKRDVGYKNIHAYKSENAAARAAQQYVGQTPEIVGNSAFGNFGQRVDVEGINIKELFPMVED